VPQTGITNNDWDVATDGSNFDVEDFAYNEDLEFSTIGYDLSGTSYDSVSFSVASQDTSLTDLTLSTDGTKMFVLGIAGDAVYEYTLSTAGDLSTASYVDSFSVASQDTSARGLVFSPDGTKMYIAGTVNDTVYQYSLSTAWDVSTASYASKSFSVSGQDTTPYGIAFSASGTRMIIGGNANDTLYQYTLSTAWDVSTASYDAVSFSVSAQDANPSGIAFNDDGTKLYITGYSNDYINEYTLSTAYDLSTIAYSTQFSVTSQDTSPVGVAFNSDYTKMYVAGDANDTIYQYTVGAIKAANPATSSWTSEQVGMTIEGNGGVAVLDDTSGNFTESTAFTDYSTITAGNWTLKALVFDADGVGVSGYVTGFDLSSVSYIQAFSVASQDTAPRGIAFSTDGAKMFVAGQSSNSVHEYTLSTNFDVSTASYVDAYSLAAQITQLGDLAFNTDGTKMYILDQSAADVNQYTLTTGFDVSTASYNNSFSVSAQETTPRALTFSTDGSRMFVGGDAGNDISAYTLSTNFNISTASSERGFTISAQEGNPLGVGFNTDGTKMFITGNDSDSLLEYSLTTGFDIGTASYVSGFSLSAQTTVPAGIAFNADGTKIFIVDSASDRVLEYNFGASTVTSSTYPAAFTNATGQIDSQYWTDLNSMTATENLDGANIYYAISTDDRTTWSVMKATDGQRDIVRNNAGTWEYNDNTTYGSETWTAASTNTERGALKDAMDGALGAVSNAFDISTASYSGTSFSVAAQDTAPLGVAFNTDGTKMFVVGITNDAVYEYTLSTGFDVSTASYVDSFSVGAQDTEFVDIAFNTDGTKMFLIGSQGDDVNEYTLSTGFDVSTASFVDSFSVASKATEPRGVCFSTDGTKMFVIGLTSDAVHEYALSTGFDVSTSSFVVSFSVAAQDGQMRGLEFSADGTKMFATGSLDQDINEYSLSTAWDVSTASFVDSFSIAAQETSPRGIAFSTDGTKLFLVGLGNQSIFEYDVGSLVSQNRMDSTQLAAAGDADQVALGDTLDLAAIFDTSTATLLTSFESVSINYDGAVLNEGAVVGTDYDFDAPEGTAVRFTALLDGNYKIRVV